MIGVYDYTVILTYMSLICGVCGSIIAQLGNGHPYLGTFCLLLCGLCDTFDGQVARSKKDRTDVQKAFGIQIDSLSDLVAFGVLPAMISIGLLRSEGVFLAVFRDGKFNYMFVIYLIVASFYVLTALIRLAYFNVLASEETNIGKNGKKGYVGLPVTMAALIFPFIMALNYIIPRNLSIVYFLGMVAVGFLFISRFHVSKPGKKLLIFLISIGVIEFVVLIFVMIVRKRGIA